MKNRDFRISKASRSEMSYEAPLFETTNKINEMYRQAQDVTYAYNESHGRPLSAASVHICAVLHLVYQTVISAYLRGTDSDPFSRIRVLAEKNSACKEVLSFYNNMFPSRLSEDRFDSVEEMARAFFVHQVLEANPAIINATGDMLSQSNIEFPQGTKALIAMMGSYLKGTTFIENTENADDLFSFLTMPARLFPDSLLKQLEYISEHWDLLLPAELIALLTKAKDYLKEETKPHFAGGGPGPIEIPNFKAEDNDYEMFTPDKNWMPNVVMMAKSTLVWLDQLSKKYNKDISRLDQIPDEELDELKDRGFNALWLIGLWERSPASKKIKVLCGNSDAEASAYSLKGYEISSRLGGWQALENLKTRSWERGIRLASDMVPNHTGIDSDWMMNHSDYFVQQSYPPFPSYTFNGPNLSEDPKVDIRIEDHYYNRTDAAVTFRRIDNTTGQVSYIFHGNDGTAMPWNDTAQLDFLNPTTREAVIQQILAVARNFHIIRFDAAMTLAKRHIQRLWYPKPGTGGDVAGRIPYEMSDEEFNRRIPNEFWREVVDRISQELPDTLLIAEAFWMMESFFVRTLGMHRVYNSAFMHMIKNQDNEKYRDMIKATIAFDPEILKRYVNFMNNPDEDTAIAQFGDSDKYFGACTLLATMPGLPMFGHGQIEGFREKYGMEYQRAYWDEKPNERLIEEHKRRIFPLLKMRTLFSESKYFQIFDVKKNDGSIAESVFAYTNGNDQQMALVLYNNQYEHVEGTITESSPKLVRNGDSRNLETVSIAKSLRLSRGVRRYAIYKDFNEGLYHLIPSVKLYEEGLTVSLNGYQTKVFTNIYEIEDIDGIYQKLYEKLGNRGVADLDYEMKVLYLEPFFEAVEPIKNQKFVKDLKTLLNGSSSNANKKGIMQTLGTCYTYMEELNGLFEKLGLHPKTIKAQMILGMINNIEVIGKTKPFQNANLILDDNLATVVSAAFLEIPFIHSNNSSLEEMFNIAKTLHFDRLFDVQPTIALRCALLTSTKPKEMKDLLEDKTFQILIGCNEYQGICWYRGEAFQECLYLNVLSKTLDDKNIKEGQITEKCIKNAEEELDKWLKRSSKANYKLKNLIEEPEITP